jgi:hypothetical protein
MNKRSEYIMLKVLLVTTAILLAISQQVLSDHSNGGGLHFEDESTLLDFTRSGGEGLGGAAWLDFNQDGDLDLFLTGGGKFFNRIPVIQIFFCRAKVKQYILSIKVLVNCYTISVMERLGISLSDQVSGLMVVPNGVLPWLISIMMVIWICLLPVPDIYLMSAALAREDTLIQTGFILIMAI